MSEVPAGLELARYERCHREGVARLQERLWSADAELNARFFDWRYGDAACGGGSLVYLLLRGGIPVAMRALRPERWRAGGLEQEVFLADDLVIDREYEGRGLFAILTAALRSELEARGHEFFLSLSALRVTKHQSLKLGAHSLDPMQALGRLRPAARILDRVRTAAGQMPLMWRLARGVTRHERAAAFFDRLDMAATARYGTRSGLNVMVEVRPRAMETAEFIGRLPDDGRIRRVRDAGYLAWRFANPLHDYRCVRAERDGHLRGYLIVERALSDLANPRRCHIADWEADTPETHAELLRFVLDAGRPPELVTWQEACDPGARLALTENGFLPIDAAQRASGLPSILVWPVRADAGPRPLAIGSRSLLDLRNWNLRLADTSYA
jgi:hypothetical protein